MSGGGFRKSMSCDIVDENSIKVTRGFKDLSFNPTPPTTRIMISMCNSSLKHIKRICI